MTVFLPKQISRNPIGNELFCLVYLLGLKFTECLINYLADLDKPMACTLKTPLGEQEPL